MAYIICRYVHTCKCIRSIAVVVIVKGLCFRSGGQLLHSICRSVLVRPGSSCVQTREEELRLSPHESTTSAPARTESYNTIILRTGQRQLAPRRFRRSKRKRGKMVGEIGCRCCSKGCSVWMEMCDFYFIGGYLATKSTHGTFFMCVSVSTLGLTNPFTLLKQL